MERRWYLHLTTTGNGVAHMYEHATSMVFTKSNAVGTEAYKIY